MKIMELFIKPAVSYKTVISEGYRWFIPDNQNIPEFSPDTMLEDLPELLNSSRTTYVKRGYIGSEEVYLKRYNNKGLLDTIKNLFRKSRALKSMEGAIVVKSLGFNTPDVLFACEKRIFGILIRSFIATKGIKARNLVDLAQNKSCTFKLLSKIASYIKQMHASGIFHIDLKGENMLVDDKGDIFIIDLDRLKLKHSLTMSQIIKNLSYLNASFVQTVKRPERLRFLDEYLKSNEALINKREELITGIEKYTAKRLSKRY